MWITPSKTKFLQLEIVCTKPMLLPWAFESEGEGQEDRDSVYIHIYICTSQKARLKPKCLLNCVTVIFFFLLFKALACIITGLSPVITQVWSVGFSLCRFFFVSFLTFKWDDINFEGISRKFPHTAMKWHELARLAAKGFLMKTRVIWNFPDKRISRFHLLY